jgi:DNA-binding LacI/PurR family transcriptional regulator
VAVRSRVGKKTIVDLAAASGVSVTTVSRILNGKPDVADETRERVLRVMDEIGFAPQSAWRQIRSGRSGLIGVHVPQDFNPPNLHMIMSAALGVEDAGYSINIITRSLSDNELLGIFRSREVDGIILLEVLANDRRPELLRDHGFPFVMAGRRADNTGISFVDVDIEHAITVAMAHLVELGHRSIAFLSFDPVLQEERYGLVTWALDAYEQACARAGLQPLPCLGGVTGDEMAAAALRMLDSRPEVTAFVAPQESSAVGVLRAAEARHLRVPDDLSVVAMLSEMSGDLATPPLTTVPFPADEMGAASARMLIGMLTQGQQAGEHLLVRTELRIGGSTAAPGRAGS